MQYWNLLQNLTLRWHIEVKNTSGMFNLNLSPFKIWKWYLHGPVTLEKVINFFVENVIFRYSKVCKKFWYSK